MVYITRDEQQNINGWHRRQQFPGQEAIEENDPELQAFLTSCEEACAVIEKKTQKIYLKLEIDAGTTLGFDMSKEQTAFDAL